MTSLAFFVVGLEAELIHIIKHSAFGNLNHSFRENLEKNRG